jgi:signal peptidase II
MQTTPGTSLNDVSPSAPARRGLLLLVALVAAGVYAVDQGSKALAVSRLDPGEPRQVVGELLQLHLIRNAGAAFSLATGVTWVLTVVAIVVVVVVVRSARRLGSPGWAIILGLLLGGALGNLTDRLLREPGFGRGHVVDFIDYGGLFIGNVAAIAIVLAAAAVALQAVRGIGLDGSTHGRPQRRRDGPLPDDEAEDDVHDDRPGDHHDDHHADQQGARAGDPASDAPERGQTAPGTRAPGADEERRRA